MSSIAFDTLAYAKKLRATGFNEQQDEALAEAQAELVDERLATKHDLRKSSIGYSSVWVTCSLLRSALSRLY